MDKYNNISKKNKAGLVFVPIIAVIELLCSLFSIIGIVNKDSFALSLNLDTSIINIICYIAIICYAFFGYRKPHGNLLRFLYLFSAAGLTCRAIVLNSYSAKEDGFRAVLISVGAVAFAALLIAYVGGRLNKFTKNKVVLSVVCVLLLIGNIVEAVSYSGRFNLFGSVETFGGFMLAVSLTIIYVARYEQHKEAGLETN